MLHSDGTSRTTSSTLTATLTKNWVCHCVVVAPISGNNLDGIIGTVNLASPATYTDLRVHNGHNGLSLSYPPDKRDECSRGGGLTFIDRFTNTLRSSGCTCYVNTICLKVHGSQFRMSLHEETGEVQWDLEQFWNLFVGSGNHRGGKHSMVHINGQLCS